MDVRTRTEGDLAAIQRIWREVGWVDEDEATQLEPFLADADVRVAVLDGEAEACASIHRGTLHHTGTDLDAAVVSSVTTSRVGRKQGLARAVLRDVLVAAAEDGAAVAALGMFEQGFYDLLGFGTGAEQVFHRLDPASLAADLPYRRPVRLTADDAADLTACLLARRRAHGAVSLPSIGMRAAESQWTEGGFGLGYRDVDGTLTHFVWCSSKGEHGPYRVTSWAWQDREQLRELLGVLRSLGDQVRWLVLPEPGGTQVQALTGLPGRQYLLTKGTDQHYRIDADAWWQARILDLPTCVAAVSAVSPLRCNLRLTDPLADGTPAWDRVAGDWVLSLDESSTVTRGHDDALPTLTTTVNAFTRLWLGVRSATGLALSDPLEASEELLVALDHSLHLPRPDVGMDF